MHILNSFSIEYLRPERKKINPYVLCKFPELKQIIIPQENSEIASKTVTSDKDNNTDIKQLNIEKSSEIGKLILLIIIWVTPAFILCLCFQEILYKKLIKL